MPVTGTKLSEPNSLLRISAPVETRNKTNIKLPGRAKAYAEVSGP